MSEQAPRPHILSIIMWLIGISIPGAALVFAVNPESRKMVTSYFSESNRDVSHHKTEKPATISTVKKSSKKNIAELDESPHPNMDHATNTKTPPLEKPEAPKSANLDIAKIRQKPDGENPKNVESIVNPVTAHRQKVPAISRPAPSIPSAKPYIKPHAVVISPIESKKSPPTTQIAAMRFPNPLIEPKPAPRPAIKIKADCKGCPVMVPMPAGKVTIGSLHGNSNEQPVWTTHSTRNWSISQTEITVGQWLMCVRGGACELNEKINKQRRSDPVTYVSWEDSKGYADWLSTKTDKNYRLPSEAEWEYAAKTPGKRAVRTLVNCRRCPGASGLFSARPVATFKANGFKLFDMLGNVAEWVEDCKTNNYRHRPDRSLRPMKTGNCSRRGIRGGSWAQSKISARPSARDFKAENTKSSDIGFRVVKDY